MNPLCASSTNRALTLGPSTPAGATGGRREGEFSRRTVTESPPPIGLALAKGSLICAA
jgi:hypothetical protein